MEGTSRDGTSTLQHHEDVLKVQSRHLKEEEGIYAWIEWGRIHLEICMEKEGTYLVSGSGCAEVFEAYETCDSGECISGHTLTQWLDGAGCQNEGRLASATVFALSRACGLIRF